MLFLSTLPARGATPQGALVRPGEVQISIHAPREGSDLDYKAEKGGTPYFYPRSPRGERPTLGRPPPWLEIISIHAPREGSDVFLLGALICEEISIHAPREGSDAAATQFPVAAVQFLSTLPARGATCWPSMG